MQWSRGELFRITGLYLLIIPFLNVLNATGYVNSQIQGHFGASSTEFMYINLVPVFTLIAGIPLALALSKQFPLKSLMLSVVLISIALNTCSAFVNDIYWYILFRSLLAFFSVFGIVAAIVPLTMRYNPKFNMPIMYGIIQFIVQGSSHLYKYFGAHFAQIYDWKNSLLLLNINFLVCILLTFIFIKKDVTPSKQSFRFDFTGWILLILILVPVLFLSCEGPNREWFSDKEISFAVASFFILIGVYILHAKNHSAPLIDFSVFKYRNVLLGSIFFFLIGVLNNTGSVIIGYMNGLLGFDEIYMARTHLHICIGLIISIPVCTYMLFHRIYLSIAAIIGFFAFTAYHLILYFRFYPGIDESDFIFPFIIKGIGIGFLYVLSSLYISENIPKHLSTSRMMCGVLARNIFAMLLGAAILNTTLNHLTVQHKTGISQQFSLTNKEAASKYSNTKKYFLSQGYTNTDAESMANKSLQKEFAETAMLLSYKDVYLIMAFISFIPILMILFLGLGKRPVKTVSVEPIPI